VSGERDSLEWRFGVIARACGWPEPVREFRFAPDRRWRFDFAWPDRKIAVELEGGSWIRGRHVRGDGFTRDCEKYNAAVAAGWRVFRFTDKMLDDVSCLRVLHDVLRRQEDRRG